MIFLQRLYFILFFALVYLPLLSFLPLVKVMGYFVLTLLCLLLLHFFLTIFQRPPKLWEWLNSPHWNPYYGMLCFLIFLSFILSLWMAPRNGLFFQFQPQDSSETIQFSLNSSQFNLQPAAFIDHEINQNGTLTIQGYFYSPHPLVRALFHISHGNAVWKLDGEVVAEHDELATNRYLRIDTPLSEGFHHVECEVQYRDPIPSISLSLQNVNQTKPATLQGPFFYGFYPLSWNFYPFYKYIPPFLLAFSLILLIPVLNPIIGFVIQFHRSFLKTAYSSWIILLLFTLLFVFIRTNFISLTLDQYEADEAAFGLMAQNLNQGQSPPHFHYGQKYQGIAEVFPLSLIQTQIEDPVRSLKILPFFWGILFLLFTLLAYWLIGSKGFLLCSAFFLLLGGSHFHWIITKNWFGYSFSLAAGAILIFISLLAYKKKRISPGWAFLWGSLAGVALYQLPISFPFVFFSFLIILLIPLQSSYHVFSREFLKNCWNSGIVFCGLFLIIFLFPYWGAFLYQAEDSSIQYLAEGRTLPPPRVVDEKPLIDRFLGECLPTLLGIRAPYDQQHPLPSAIFPHLPVLLFLFGLLSYPFARKWIAPQSLLSKSGIYFSLYFFAIVTILLVTYSSFGIWPWYAIALFWFIPILFSISFTIIWRFSPGLSVFIFILLTISLFSPFFSYTKAFHQPLSLSNHGLKMPIEPYERIINTLKENKIRYLVCDQGYDMSPDHTGRDWLGETISYYSNLQIIAFDALSRRLTFMAQEIIYNEDVAYLFHKNFYYNNPSLDRKRDYSPLTIDHIKTLFGEDFLKYQIIDCDPYLLFIPPKDRLLNPKSKLSFHSTLFWFFRAINDHNISVRSYGRETYWTSEQIQESGTFLQITLDKPQTLSKIVLFHGTKTSDYTPENQVYGVDVEGNQVLLGSLTFYPEINGSVLNIVSSRKFEEITIDVQKPETDHWWTIFELWIF